MDATANSRSGLETIAEIAESVLEPFRDAWIVAKARVAVALVARGEGVITVEALRGSVVLSGDVPSAELGARIESAVRGIGGVVAVCNQLRVLPATPRPCYSDAEISRSVAARLRADAALRNSLIRVRAVYNGLVVLTGIASDPREHFAAFEAATHVPGVRRVASEVAGDFTPTYPGRVAAAA